MLTVSGLVLNVVPGSYQGNDGKTRLQLDLVIFPDDPNAKESVQVQYNASYYETPGFENQIRQLQGKRVAVSVAIFSFKNGGYKLVATALPKIVKTAETAAA